MTYMSRYSCPSGRRCLAIVSASLIMFASLPSSAQDERVSPGQHASKKFTVKLEAKPHTQYCQARAAIEYSQKNDITRVSGEITKEGCTAAGGDYTMAIRYRDENGEVHDLEFEEQWTSDNVSPVTFEADYTIGENVDLVRVRAKRLRCVCVESDDAGEDLNPDENQDQN